MDEREYQIRLDLNAVREQIRNATKASSVTLDAHSLTRQSLDLLMEREAQLETDLAQVLRGGSPFGRTTFVRPAGRVSSYPYWRGQRYDETPEADQE